MRRLMGVAVVVVCIGVPLVESFDRWDHTLSDGNDTEANFVLVALCVGLALSTSATIVGAPPRSRSADGRFARLQAIATPAASRMPIPTGSPPRTPLRI